MSLEIFLLLLLIVSIFTGLFTEGIKKLMDEVNKKYLSNFLAGFVAVVLSVLVDAGYIILTEAQINAKMAVYLIALVLLSWLASMVGYDKVIQAIKRSRHGKCSKNRSGGACHRRHLFHSVNQRIWEIY